MKLAFSHEMNQIDALAAKRFKLTVGELMERAAAAAVQTLIQKAGPLSKKTIGIVCGKGNNGGDGLAAARLLKKKGIAPLVFLGCEPKNLNLEAAKQYQKAKGVGVRMILVSKAGQLPSARAALSRCDFLMDALLGTGLSRVPQGITRDLIEMMNRSGKPILALDTPSGFCVDQGAAFGSAVHASFTVTFGLLKPGFYMPGAAAFTGPVSLAPIGLPPELLAADFLSGELIDRHLAREVLPRYDQDIHKGTRGRVLVVAGSLGLTGAAALSAWGAQRVGAGLVTVACAQSLLPILAVKLTEAMTAPLPEVRGGFISRKAATKILQLAQKADAVVIGPGLGRHPETAKLLAKILPQLSKPLVLDADALFLLSGQEKLVRKLKAPVLLTPHSGEAGRLLGISAVEVERNRLKIAKQIAREYNGVAVLKGPHTVIARASGAVRINPTGNRALATGGTGDVLSGILGGLLAQGLTPFDAAAAGVYLHGLAGEKAGEIFGPDGLLAGDLLPILPQLLKQIRE